MFERSRDEIDADCEEILKTELSSQKVSGLIAKLYDTEIDIDDFIADLKDDLDMENILSLLVTYHKRRVCELSVEIKNLSKDKLTGFYTRTQLEEERGTISAMVDRKRPVGFIMLDLDNFKCLNDSYGHRFGDSVLQMVGSSILTSVRRYDMAYRYGGEEFLLLLKDVTPSSLRKIAEKTIARISSLKIPHNSSSIGITASAGFYANSEGLFP
ncbi:MAG: GGDEF domain-containing protein, partial [Nitrospirae bacterium]|nr:GGDEF domain-containing protein [Nitrospirota bacterium]